MCALDSPPIPILLACHTLGPGGTERQMTEMALHLDRTRFRPHVMSFNPEGFRADELRSGGVPVVELPVRSFRDFSVLRAAGVFRAYLNEHNIQVVHPFDYPTVTFMAPLARWFGAPVVLGSARGERALFPPLYRRALRFTDRLVHGIVANSPFCADELIRIYGVAPDRIFLAPNGVDTVRFQPGHRSDLAPFRNAELVIGAVSVLRPEKSLENLIDAFQLLTNRHASWRLLIVGGGESETTLRRRAAAALPSDRYRFLPSSSDVSPYYRAMDIFVLPSRSEAFSNALLEAMASGVCPVASEAGGNPYILRHDDNGCLFPVGDSQALANLLERLGTDPQTRHRLADTARHEAVSRYSLRAAADRLGEIYTSVLRQAAIIPSADNGITRRLSRR